MVAPLIVAMLLSASPICAGMSSTDAKTKMKKDGWISERSTTDTCGGEGEAKWKCLIQIWVNSSGKVSYAQKVEKEAVTVLMFNSTGDQKWRLHRVVMCPLGCQQGATIYNEVDLPACRK